MLRKAGRYGTPDLPLVVALNAADQDFRLEHAIEALFGTEVCVTTSGNEDGRSERLADGVWWGPRGPQCTRLSAVSVADRLGPWTLGTRSATFVENLWASRPADFVNFQVEAWRPEGEGLRYHNGDSLQDIF